MSSDKPFYEDTFTLAGCVYPRPKIYVSRDDMKKGEVSISDLRKYNWKGIPIAQEHLENNPRHIGKVTEAWFGGDGSVYTAFEVDNPLHQLLAENKKFRGLSLSQEHDRETGELLKVSFVAHPTALHIISYAING